MWVRNFQIYLTFHPLEKKILYTMKLVIPNYT